MTNRPVPKKTLSSILSKFDCIATKTRRSGNVLAERFQSYVELNHPDNYSNVRNDLKKISEMLEKIPFIKKFVLTPEAQSNRANFISRFFGGSTAFMALGMIKTAFVNPVKAGAVVGSLLWLGKTNYSAPLAFVMGEVGFPAKAITFAPVIMTGLTITTALAVFAAWQVHTIRQAGKFAQRHQTITDEITSLLESQGVSSTPKLDKLVRAYEKSFKPDFSPQQTQAIRDALAVQRSESGIAAGFTPSQAESLKRITDTLTKQYFVPSYLATNAGLNMIVEMDGNEKAVMAKLKSRNIEEDWVNRFKMEPLSTVEGARKSREVVDDPKPSP